jgi:hypothetical protein
MAASKSIPEWMASDIMLTEPLKRPATIFNAIKVVLDNTDNKATFVFLFELLSFLNLPKILATKNLWSYMSYSPTGFCQPAAGNSSPA